MILKRVTNLVQFAILHRHDLFQRRQVDAAGFLCRKVERLWGPDAGDDVLALGVDQILAIELVNAGGRIAGERDASGTVSAEISEDHGLDVDRGAPFRRKTVQLAVGNGALVHPGTEDGADGTPELLFRILREPAAEVALNDFLVELDNRLPIGRRHVRVELVAPLSLGRVQDFFEIVEIHAQDDVGVHLDETAVAVIGKPRVIGRVDQPLDGGVVQAEIEDRIHHAGHRRARAGTHGDQQRITGITETLSGILLQKPDGVGNLRPELRRVLPVMSVEIGADLGSNRKAGRNRQSHRTHLGKVGALTAEQILHLGAAVRGVSTEIVDPFRHIGDLPSAAGLMTAANSLECGPRYPS